MEITAPSSPALSPVSAPERILMLDVLRGIALFGVLASNIWADFSGHSLLRVLQQQPAWAMPDTVANFLIRMLVKGKAMSAFSFLFGLGFAVQMIRAEARGVAIAPLFRRRLVVLAGFGAAHLFLIWWGDILHAYALLGFALLLFRRASTRALVSWAVAMWGVAAVLFAWPELASLLSGAAAPVPDKEAAAQVLAGFQSGSVSQILRSNLQALRVVEYAPPITGMLAVFPYDFGFFLLGLWAGRRRLFEDVSAHRTLFRRAVWIALPAGMAAHLLLIGVPSAMRGEPAPWRILATEILYDSNWILTTLGYIAAATLLLEHERWRRWLSAFSPVGRMALTNYLAQSVICVAIFYGGGLVGRTGPAASVGIACLIYPVQMFYSRWWLARYRFGPMEWLWRSLTYGQRQPMRRPQIAEEDAVAPVLAG
jgi:uncharacterized protein